MNEIIEKENVIVENMIYEVRGVQVMLASDVAKLYNSEVRIINQVVKRNINRFPTNFCFQLTSNEYEFLKSQIVISKNEENISRGGNRHLPYVFTEHGIMMLSGLLKSDVAAKVNILIINAFVAMKKYISNNLIEQKYINNMVLKHDNEIKLLQESFDKMSKKVKNNHLFYDGQVYDAYSLMIDIFNSSKESITIIDNYVDKNLLDILSKTNKKVAIITNKYNENDLSKYQKQYKNVKIIIKNKIHDRFIIIDNNTLYHCGASFKDLGVKCFGINKIKDEDLLNKMINYINN